uniref:ATP-binding protein Uup n=1 Tax=Candidatus Kentrum sp. SD TaxID=2126332 RepID=A0A451BJR3_9GAMM|nr:MAG: ATP-binding cassette, subfamily F, uup [Candidatus Kentron sp. SD]VFK43845.1 MAG: ATP-binding cassette, subfamily F, uup [Candidatus Kentron sp. SD]VFK78530.1 MAG: ATP-binding cassette, subfamily F, uup [Candidatus Kentron sp. SD]
MPLINLRDIQLRFGGPALLEQITFSIEKGERICLLGRNGAGKSTLMRLIAGEIQPDDGRITTRQGAIITRLPQEAPQDIGGSVFDVVSSGLGALGELIRQYHHLATRLEGGDDAALLGRLSAIQHRLEVEDGWRIEQRVETVISRLSLDADVAFPTLSGGLKRKVLLARALVPAPDLLLLDEPTNHLDIAAIDWIETFLSDFGGALLFVTHDRAFLQRLATRIIELDRGRLTDWPDDYRNFLRRKEEMLNAEEKANARFDKKLAQEEVWIRQGIKARRTRNEGRARALRAMREEHGRREIAPGKVRMASQKAEQSGKLVVEAKNIHYAWDGVPPLIKAFSTTILRGDKVGVIGPNGVGKTTLLNLLFPLATNTSLDNRQQSIGVAEGSNRSGLPSAASGPLTPNAGEIRFGARLEVAYFDQMRAILNEEESVRDNVADGSDRVITNGRTKHVVGYLRDFLFPPDRIRQPVKALSGGERNRLLLAKLFTKPANVLIMDEPTNDLDIETLELLEELLLDYQGTLLLVSHDRAFLDNVVTSTLVFEGNGRIAEYVGGYDDWLRQRVIAEPIEKKSSHLPTPSQPKQKPGKTSRQGSGNNRSTDRKPSYKAQRELDALPARIQEIEAELTGIQTEMSSPDFYKQTGKEIAAMTARLASVEAELANCYRRWEVLEG